MDNKTFKYILGALSFGVSIIVYLMTVAPTVSFWDCGEFIACSFRLSVPHPPGAPVYLLLGRFFSMLPLGNVAFRVNLISVISSAFTVLFLYLIIHSLIREYMQSERGFFRFIPAIGAAIGALTFAFTESFWFNAVEAEVYAPSMFFSSLLVYLALYWSEKQKEPGNERYIILMAYLMGLAMGVHILNALVIPTMVMLIYYRKYEVSFVSFAGMAAVGVGLTLLFYPGVVKGIPEIISRMGFGGMVLVFLAMLGLLIWTMSEKRHVLSIFLLSALLVSVGYSSYMMVYIRSGLDPNIDENNPETIEKFISYMNREQYGDHHFDRARRLQESPNGAQYQGNSSDFFWNYQIDKMYIRYFKCNFFGTYDGDGGSLIGEMQPEYLKFFGLPMLLGFIGMFFHAWRDWKRALAVFVLFFATGLAIVLYLNQPDPQPRERDYSYVGSFFAFSIWIGIGAAALLEVLTELLSGEDTASGAEGSVVPWIATVLLFCIPAVVLAKNYRTHDRSGNFVAYDYSYNMLMAAEENGIMLTNGDNDTFPLWYLQEVEDIRTDVRVANLSLLNTDWYIEQLKNKEPKVPMSLSDEQISKISVQYWPDKQRVEIPLPSEEMLRPEGERYRISQGLDSIDYKPRMSFEVKPKHYVPGPNGQRVGLLRVQDLMILNMLNANKFEKPLYFAVTTSSSNQLDGLRDYLRMDGLLFRITPFKGWEMDPEVLYDNLMNKFKFRNLNNPDVFYNDNIIGLLQNYRSAFFRLGAYYMENGEMDKFNEVLKRCFEVMPEEVIPYTSGQFRQVMVGLGLMAGYYPIEDLTPEKYSFFDIESYAQIAMTYNNYSFARKALEVFINGVEKDLEAAPVQQYVRSLFRQQEYYEQSSPAERLSVLNNRLKVAKQQLVKALRETGDLQGALDYLDKWELLDPQNDFIGRERERVRKQMQESK